MPISERKDFVRTVGFVLYTLEGSIAETLTDHSSSSGVHATRDQCAICHDAKTVLSELSFPYYA